MPVRDPVQIWTVSGWVTATFGLPARAGAEDGAMGMPEARAIVRSLQRDESWPALMALHALIATVEVTLPSRLRREELSAEIARALDEGRLRLYRGWGRPEDALAQAAAPAAELGPAATLARELMGGRRDVLLQGRRYRLVPASAARRGPGARDYRPVSPGEGRLLLEQQAARVTDQPVLREQWRSAAALLAADGEEKLVLLRFVPPTGVAPASETPAQTPSQIRNEIAPEDWIEIQLVYDDGTPFDGACLLQLPGGRTIDGTPDETGLVRVDGLTSSGDCKLTFPDIAAALAPA
jgi:hypothetical protein